jgi:putative SOS response-associated peptidase YedK
MCGRYSLTTPVEGLRHLFQFPERPNLEPRYNIAPTQDAPVFRRDDAGALHLVPLRWGLIPPWAKDKSVGARFINARGESVTTQSAFRDAFQQRRCLVPADGFYEWPYPVEQMRAYPVSPVVNSWQNESPECFAPAAA